MSYKGTISDGTVLEKCINDIRFYTLQSDDYSSRHTNNRSSIKITGYIDTDESTVGLYNWALLPATNPDCYKEITVEHYKSGKLLRKVTFSKAFVVDYSEEYSNDEGVGFFMLHIRQIYAKNVEVDAPDDAPDETADANKTDSDSVPETEEQTQSQEAIEEKSSAGKAVMSFTERLEKKKEIKDNITIVEYGEHFTKDGRKKALKPNIQYTTPEGYTYRTDELGRIIYCEGTLQKGVAERNKYVQRTVGGKDRLPDDEGGHLVASIFKGSGDFDNLVPMDGNLNKGEWRKLENTWKKALSAEPPEEVKVKILPVYKGNSKRPERFIIEYNIGDDIFKKKNLKNAPGGK
jgi:hypothetical protein